MTTVGFPEDDPYFEIDRTELSNFRIRNLRDARDHPEVGPDAGAAEDVVRNTLRGGSVLDDWAAELGVDLSGGEDPPSAQLGT